MINVVYLSLERVLYVIVRYVMRRLAYKMNVGSRRNSVNLKFRRKGSGLLNTLINKVPFELHIPGYSYCGPGTKLKRRLERGDKGVNLLDEACKKHDIAYSDASELSKRHQADAKLYEEAVKRVKSSDAGLGEKLAASLVAVAMKGKTKMGMGLNKKYHNSVSRSNLKKKGDRQRMRHTGGAMSFIQAMKTAGQALRRIGRKKDTFQNAKIAYDSLKNIGKRIKSPRTRIIRIPKRGGILPLIPIFAALGALGSLGGGAAAIAKAANAAKAAREQLMETKRHNKAMELKEASTSGSGLYVKPYVQGCGISIGSGLYVKPYKSGCGVYSPSF